jgi:hypothetical protein
LFPLDILEWLSGTLEENLKNTVRRLRSKIHSNPATTEELFAQKFWRKKPSQMRMRQLEQNAVINDLCKGTEHEIHRESGHSTSLYQQLLEQNERGNQVSRFHCKSESSKLSLIYDRILNVLTGTSSFTSSQMLSMSQELLEQNGSYWDKGSFSHFNNLLFYL